MINASLFDDAFLSKKGGVFAYCVSLRCKLRSTSHSREAADQSSMKPALVAILTIRLTASGIRAITVAINRLVSLSMI